MGFVLTLVGKREVWNMFIGRIRVKDEKRN